MNKWSFRQNGFTRTALWTTVILLRKMSFFLHIDMTSAVPVHDRLLKTSNYTNQNAFNMFKAFEKVLK